jgi:protein-disulfide isomerase
MKVRILLAGAMAALALAGCKKSQSDSEGTPVADSGKVTITQANPPPGGTWGDVVNATTAGFMMGNPNAKVKLIEIGSLSCPHCKKFEEEGVPKLIDKYVKSGQVSWEFRPYVIHGPIDMATNIVARCSGAKAFFPLTMALYKDQDTILNKVQAAPQDKLNEIQNLPTNQVFVQMANLMGLQDWAAARGVPQAKSNQCLADQKMIDNEVQFTADVSNQYPEFTGTPAFVISGKMADKDVTEFEKLDPLLEAAVK